MRTSGVLLPISSLPSRYGIGTLGKAAYTFIDFLVRAGQTYWQVLPIGPTSVGDSPYQSFSAMAGNPYFIDLDLLVAGGLLQPSEIPEHWEESPEKVEYHILFTKRFGVLAKAVARQNKSAPAYLEFCRKNANWLDDYALFMALKEAHDYIAFSEWPEELRLRNPQAIKAAEAQYGPRIEFWRCLQFFFFRQWRPLKSYANSQGIQLIGDIPIYVSPDSSDLWAKPELFQLDAQGRLSGVAGVPPDAFSDDGQLWGNPLYDWKVHKRTRYDWWLQRMHFMADLFDMVRIDHFRGFAGYYSVPTGESTAKNGRWRRGPGKDFIHSLHRALPETKVIAEDLGFLTEEVHELLAFSGYPGMKVLQFAFDSREESDYLPHNYHRHTVVYTGTHDNTTTQDWEQTAIPEDVEFARSYLGLLESQNLTEGIIRAALSSVADTAIIPIQDWLLLGAEARINRPSTLGGNNWRWRLLEHQVNHELADKIRKQTRLYGRLSQRERAKEAKAEMTRPYIEYEVLDQEEFRKSQEKGTIMMQHRCVTPDKLEVLTVEQIREAEQQAVKNGISYEQLMEKAGTSAADFVISNTAQEQAADLEQGSLLDRKIAIQTGEVLIPVSSERKPSVLLMCGQGNNAGDAFVMGRILAQQGWSVEWLPLFEQEYSPLAFRNLQKMKGRATKIDIDTLDYSQDVIVDAVFGIGFHGSLPPHIIEAFEKANASDSTRIALDLPSGLDSDTGSISEGCFCADITLTFGALKPALLRPEAETYYGKVYCLDIGLS